MLAVSAAESVRVVCRFRPHREQLIKGPSGQAGSVAGPTTATGKTRTSAGPSQLSASAPILSANGAHNPSTGYKLEYGPDGKSLAFTPPQAGGVRAQPYDFVFDQILPSDSTQSEAFDAIAKATVADVLKGYNGSIFAYGQTGSGKTHTMFGRKEPDGTWGKLRGVIPRAADDLFAGIADSEEIEEVTIKCSMLEIYKENVRDILQPKNTGLKIRETPSGEVYVQGISDEYVSSCEDIMKLLAQGEKNRTVASTDMNAVSSRSHSVLIIVVNQKLKDGSVRVGKLNLADLAGSERIERTNATGETLAEAKKINQSLSALGNCVMAMTDSKRTHIPFRDSTLTFLLKDSLGGNSKTTMLVCASPEESDNLETLSTLNFAKRAKRIKNSVSVNLKLGVAELTLMVAELRKELAIAHKTIFALQKTIGTMQAGGSIPKEMLNSLLKPFTSSASVTAIEQLTPSDTPITELSTVSATMLHNALERERRASQDVRVSPSSSASPSASADASSSPITNGPLSPEPSQSLNSTLETPIKASVPSTPIATEPAPSVPTSVDTSLAFDTSALDASSTMIEPPPTLMGEPQEESVSSMTLPTLPGSNLSTPRSDLDAPQLPPDDSDSAAQSTSASPHTVPSDSLTSSVAASLERDEKLTQAQLEIEQLKAQLEAAHQASQQRERDWHRERDSWRMEQEKAEEQRQQFLLQQQSIASIPPTGVPSSPATNGSITSPPTSAIKSGTMSDASKVIALISKNERLEKQMEEMKSTWTAYLDLILENQKALEKERRNALIQQHQHHPIDGDAHTKNAKIVKPVRKSGFFSFFRSDKSNLTSPAGPSSEQKTTTDQSVKSSPVLKPQPDPTSTFNSPDGPRQSTTAPTTPATAPSSAAPRHARAQSTLPLSTAESRGTMDHAIRIGYLNKKPVGFSITRQWRKRLFILRPDSLDYYELQLQPTDSPSTPASPTASSTSSDSTRLTPSLSFAAGHPANFQVPSNLKQSFRGSIELDSQTTVVAVSYSDVPWGLEVTTKDKHSKLSANTEAERLEWLNDLQAVIQCKKSGVDPNSLILASISTQPSPSPSPSADFTLDPRLLENANSMLSSALAKLPEPSPSPVILTEEEKAEQKTGETDGLPVQRDLFGAGATTASASAANGSAEPGAPAAAN